MALTRCIDCDQYIKETYYCDNQPIKMVISCGACKLAQKNICTSDPFNEIPSWCPKALKAGADIGEAITECKLVRSIKETKDE